MTKNQSEDNRLKCSFCGKTQDNVKKLIAGPGVYICDECVDLCNDILDAEGLASSTDEIDRLKSARNDILRVALTQSESWIVRRATESSTGRQVFVQDNPLGTSIEEKVLYASALEDLVRDGCLSQCGEEMYQVTWRGLTESKQNNKPPVKTIDQLISRLAKLQHTSDDKSCDPETKET